MQKKKADDEKITLANYKEMIPKLGEINIANGGSSLYTSALVVEINLQESY